MSQNSQPSPHGLVEASSVDHTPAFRRMPVVTAVPSGLLTQQVYVPRSSSLTTRMVNSWKFFRVDEMRRWPLLSRRTPSVTRQSQPWLSPGQPQHPARPVCCCLSTLIQHPNSRPAPYLYSRWPGQVAVPTPGRPVSLTGPGPQPRLRVLLRRMVLRGGGGGRGDEPREETA